MEEVKHSPCKFIIATNEMEVRNLSAAMQENYKAQGASIKQDFRFLKDPMFFANSWFSKSPARIIALIMIIN